MPSAKTTEALAEAREKLAELERQAAAEDAMRPDQRLADELHDVHCRWNHADQCGWFYESGWGTPNPGATHRNYVIAADAILNITDADTAIAVLKIVKRAG